MEEVVCKFRGSYREFIMLGFYFFVVRRVSFLGVCVFLLVVVFDKVRVVIL